MTRPELEAMSDPQLSDLGKRVGDELIRRRVREGERLQARIKEFGFVLEQRQRAAQLMSDGDEHLRAMERKLIELQMFAARYMQERTALEARHKVEMEAIPKYIPTSTTK